MPEHADIESIFNRHVKTVYRMCYSYFGNAADAEDATQSVFMKLVDRPRVFDSVEHERAWLLVCAANHCKDVLKSAQRKRVVGMPDELVDPSSQSDEGKELLEAVLALPEKYKDCVYLYYYEGYSTDEIAMMTNTPASTVRNRISDARSLLKRVLGDD